VRIVGFQGALTSRATISEISISDDLGVWITLTGVTLDWNRSALFSRRVEVNELSAERIDLVRLPSTGPADPALPSATARPEFSLPQLPVSVNIGEVRADAVFLGAAILGEEATFSMTGAARLQDGQGEARFDAVRTDGQEGAFRFIGDFNNESRILTVDLSLTEGPNGIVGTLLSIPGNPALGLSVQGQGPIDNFAADIALATDGEERVTGSFTLIDETPETGMLEGGAFSLDIQGDLRPLLTADLHPFFGASSSLRATGQRSDEGEFDLSELSVVTGAFNLDGSAAISAGGVPRAVRLTVGVERDDGEPVLLPGTSGAAFLQRATLFLNFDESVSRDWEMRAEIETLDVPDLTLGTATLDGRGRLNTNGTGAMSPQADGEPMFEGVFEFAAQRIDAVDPAVQQAIGSDFYGLISLVWPGEGKAVELRGLSFEGETVSLTANGKLDGLTFDGFTELAVPDISAFSALAGRPLGGQALANIEGQVNPLTGALDLIAELTTRDLSVGIDEADALLAGNAGIVLSLRRDTEGTFLRSLNVAAGTMELAGDGEFSPGSARATMRLEMSDLSRLGAGYDGQAGLEARFSSTSGTSRLRLDGTLSNLELGALPAADVLAGMFTGTNRLRADVLYADDVARIVQMSLIGPRLELGVEGQYSAAAPDVTVTLNRLDLAAVRPGARGQIAARAQMVGEDGTTRYALTVDGQGPLAIGIDAVDQLIGSGVSVQARATTTPDGAVRIDTARLEANGAQATISGLQDASGAARFDIDAAIENVGRLVPGISGRVALNGSVSRGAEASGYGVDLRLSGPSGMNATVAGLVNEDATVNLRMAGQVESALVSPMLEPASLSGLVSFDGTMNGPIGLNALRMNAQISGGRYSLPTNGIALADIQGQAQLTGSTAQLNATARSLAGGTAVVSGSVRLDQGRDLDLNVRVSDLVVQQPRLFEALVSGTFQVTGPMAAGALVSGDVLVETVEISIPNSPLSRGGFNLQGLSHVAEAQASRQTRVNAGIASGTRVGNAPTPMRLDLRLNAPGRVFVRGRGLDAELGGSLTLGGDTRTIIPAGSFTLIRGRLDLLGNRFNLTDGSASMVGSFIPILRLTATTESDGVLTSITVEGEAMSPDITFSSVPDLPQDEVLARLIFGRSLTSLSPFQAAQLALSVATLTGRADNSIISRTRQALGLDDLDFTVSDAGETQLRAGRRIGERVYTDVAVDSAGRSEVTINLDLTPSVTLRGRADSQGNSGFGVFFERDY
ncbi:MAG: translocation/assembly module TamB domain-containing protein, partial [Pararhodobacter sp.]